MNYSFINSTYLYEIQASEKQRELLSIATQERWLREAGITKPLGASMMGWLRGWWPKSLSAPTQVELRLNGQNL